MNLAEALVIHARARADHPAVISGERVLTHADFAALVERAAARLVADGIVQGDLIGVALRDSVDHLMLIFALARIGAVMLPMDWRWTATEKKNVAEHFSARLVFVEHDAAPFGESPTALASSLADTPLSAPAPLAQGDDLPLLLSLSSGTTGRPKGPRITHTHMLRRFWTHWINLGLNSTDVYVSATPLYFGGGRTFAMSVLFAGGTLALFPPPFAPAALRAEVSRVGATSIFLVPTQLRALLDAPEAGAMKSLRLLIASGAPLDSSERAAIEQRLCANFIEYYASTEGGGISIAAPSQRKLHPDSVGRPVFGVEVEIVGDDDAPLPAGAIGRLRYRGPAVANGYFGEESGGAAFRDGWFYPGDLAEINAAGYIFLRGRGKDMIIRGGVNIHPEEIETILREHSMVREAAVVGRASARLGEEVVAFVTLRGDVASDELASFCAARLAPYKVPKEYVVLDELPRNSAGKIVKAALATR